MAPTEGRVGRRGTPAMHQYHPRTDPPGVYASEPVSSRARGSSQTHRCEGLQGEKEGFLVQSYIFCVNNIGY